MIGFINVNKRRGDTSTFVVNRLKKIYGVKCGHMGTLDPLASGVLPVALGQSSRLFDHLVDKEKVYIATFDFSFTTPSLDLETEVSARSSRSVTEKDIKSVLDNFTGEIMQVPPDFSAKCVNGSKAYKLARKGQILDLGAKKVTINAIELLEKTGENEYKFQIACKGGTYIRSLCRDIAASLGVSGVMTSLIRTVSGAFTLENSYTLQEIESLSDKTSIIIPSDEAVSFPKIALADEDATRILNGLVEGYDIPDGLYRAYAFGDFWGVMKAEGGKVKVTYVRDL